jgi:hypothetical protein
MTGPFVQTQQYYVWATKLRKTSARARHNRPRLPVIDRPFWAATCTPLTLGYNRVLCRGITQV